MIIATHNGPFHADDVFGVAILLLIHPDAAVIRTRDPGKLQEATIRLDVGKEYNSETGDYDHHQPEGAGQRENGIPYASSGLIWKHYGMKLVKTQEAFDYIDQKIIQPMDAVDNGINTYEATTAFPYTVSDIIRAYNPNWQTERDYDECFQEAVTWAKAVLHKEITKANGIVQAQEIVRDAIKKSKNGIIVLDTFCPWKRTAIEESTAQFIIYPALGGWNIQCIPIKEESFSCRKQLPKQWAGLDGKELADVTGVNDAVFCHRNRFIAKAETKEGALKLAELAVNA